MKVAALSNSNNNGTSKKMHHVLPLEEDAKPRKLDKSNSVSWELKTNPADADSPTHKMMV